MRIKEFDYVLTVAECGNISKAAEKLFISQPALTKYIHSLENELKVKLFEKQGRQLRLNSFGQRYIEAAKQVSDICQRLDMEFHASDDKLIGELKIGSGRRGSFILSGVLVDYMSRFPSVSVSLFEKNASEIENMLLQGSIDIGIIKDPLNISNDYIEYEKLFEEEFVLVTNSGHWLSEAAGEKKNGSHYPWVDLSMLHDENFILYKSEHRNRNTTNHLMLDNNLEPKTYFETDSIEGMFDLIKSGFGIGFMPEIYARHFCMSQNSIACFSVGDPVCIQRTYVAWRKNNHMNRYSAAFIDLLRKKYAQNGNEGTQQNQV